LNIEEFYRAGKCNIVAENHKGYIKKQTVGSIICFDLYNIERKLGEKRYELTHSML